MTKLLLPGLEHISWPTATLACVGMTMSPSAAAATAARTANLIDTWWYSLMWPQSRSGAARLKIQPLRFAHPRARGKRSFVAGGLIRVIRRGRPMTQCSVVLRNGHYSIIKGSPRRHDAPIPMHLFGSPEPGDRGHAAPLQRAQAHRYSRLCGADALPALRRPHDRAGDVGIRGRR